MEANEENKENLETQEAAEAVKQKKNLTVLGSETEFDGKLSFTDTLVITGKFHGTIQSTGELEIEKSAVCDVDSITSNSIVVSGKVSGNLYAKDRIEMCSGSIVSGDIETARLRIADNVDFDGSVKMLDNVPTENLFTSASEEFKKSLIVKSDDPR